MSRPKIRSLTASSDRAGFGPGVRRRRARRRLGGRPDPDARNCGADRPSFKGAYGCGLRTPATAAETTAYGGYLQTQANSISVHETNSSGQLGLSWAGPAMEGPREHSAKAARVAALSGTTAPTGPITCALAGKCVDDNQLGTANGTAIQHGRDQRRHGQRRKGQLDDRNGTRAQVWNAQLGTPYRRATFRS